MCQGTSGHAQTRHGPAAAPRAPHHVVLAPIDGSWRQYTGGAATSRCSRKVFMCVLRRCGCLASRAEREHR